MMIHEKLTKVLTLFFFLSMFSGRFELTEVNLSAQNKTLAASFLSLHVFFFSSVSLHQDMSTGVKKALPCSILMDKRNPKKKKYIKL